MAEPAPAGFLVHRAGAEHTATHSAMSTLIRGLGGEIAELLLDGLPTAGDAAPR